MLYPLSYGREDGRIIAVVRRGVNASSLNDWLPRWSVSVVPSCAPRSQAFAAIEPMELRDIPVRDAGRIHVADGDAMARALFEEASDAMLVAGDDRIYLDANRAACRLLGLSREKIVG